MREEGIPLMIIKDSRLFEGQDIWISVKKLGKLESLCYAQVYVKKFVVSDLSVIKELVRKKQPTAKHFKVSCEWCPGAMRVGILFQI